MNRNYNVVWSQTRNMYVVASELSAGDYKIKNKFRSFTLALGVILSTTAAHAAELGPQSGASIMLHDRDTVTSTTSYAIDSTLSGGTGVQIEGAATIYVSSDTTGTTSQNGIKLDNGTGNNFGSGTHIEVNKSGTGDNGRIYGVYISNQNPGTRLLANNLRIDATSTINDLTYGIYAGMTGGSIDLGSESVVIANGVNDTRGVYIYGADSTFNIDNGVISATSNKKYATGITSSGANVDLGNHTQILINSSGYGVDVQNGSTLTGKNLIIAMNNATTAYGISQSNSGTVDLRENSIITMSGNLSGATGILMSNSNASFSADTVTINIASTSTDPNSYAYGVSNQKGDVDLGSGSTITVDGFAQGKGIMQYSNNGTNSLIADHLNVDVTGSNMYGIQMDGGAMDLGVGSSVSANGKFETVWITGGEFVAKALTVSTVQGMGIMAQSGDTPILVDIGAGSVIDGRSTTVKTNGIGIAYSGYGSATGVFNFKGTPDNRNTIYASNGYGASAQFSGKTMNIADTDIFMTGNRVAYGLWAIGNSNLGVGAVINAENTTIDMSGVTSKGGAYGVVANNGGTVNMSGDTTLLANGEVAIWNRTIGTVNGTGKMIIEGDILNDGIGSVDLVMESGSTFQGNTTYNKNLGSNISTINLSLAPQSQWNIEDASALNTLNNGGQLTFTQNETSGTWSRLDATTLVMEKSSQLNTDLQAIVSGPLVTGKDITLNGELNVSGLDKLTNDALLGTYPLIDSQNTLHNDNFQSVVASNKPDFLSISGQLNPDDSTQFDVTVGLSWGVDEFPVLNTRGLLKQNVSSSGGSGTFTLPAGMTFTVTSSLADQPPSSTGWDGKTLTKKGAGTLILSGNNSYSGGTFIDEGTLKATTTKSLGVGGVDNSGLLLLEGTGQYVLGQTFVNHAGGMIVFSPGTSLDLDTLTLEEGSTLDIYLDMSSSTPVITTQQANLGGTLNISGIKGELEEHGSVTLIDADQPINGDFNSVITVANMPLDQVDFIAIMTRPSVGDNTNYDLTYGLNWYADFYHSPSDAHGYFTIHDAGQRFTVGEVLADVAPVTATGWDGKTLTKKGNGTLILSQVNTYSGTTSIEAGTLWLNTGATIGLTGSEQNIAVAKSATFGGDNHAIVNANIDNSGNLNATQNFTINGNLSNRGKLFTGSNGTYSTLIINGNYSSNGGTLTMNTSLGDDNSQSSKLVVNGNTSGSTTLYVLNTDGQGANTDLGIEVINVRGESNGVFTQGNQMQVGLYEYRLYQDEGNWYLRTQAKDDGGDDSGGDDGGDNSGSDGGNTDNGGDADNGGDSGGNTPITPFTPQYRADIGAYLGNQWMVRHLQMQTLFDREGSQYRTEDGSLWARFRAGSADSTAANGSVANDHNYSQFQLGGDIVSWSNGVQSLNLGIMGSTIDASTDSTGNRGQDGSRFTASGDVDGYNVGVYATWFADAQTQTGLYVDSWYQYGFYNNTVKNGSFGSSSYDSSAHSVSLETGYRYAIALSNGNSVNLIPQAQAVWQNYAADSVTDNSGTRIDGQNSDSWNSRLGLRVEGKLLKGENSIRPFAEANWLHTTAGTAVSFNGAEVNQDVPADRAELKAGIQVNVANQWNLTAQATGQKGSNGYSDLNGSLNLRYSW